MDVYQMDLSVEVRELLDATAAEMVELFGISRAEAVARINEQWHGQDFSGDDEIVLHEDRRYWAMIIYFGEVPDWSDDADRSDWVPRPAPSRQSGHWTTRS
ncbi:hypothetical protein ACN27F_12770 [Solwaraspora sp. WMMB335]|uniref:hypothetical protein n=1 Tax=Solwaraspora sp. WMMB335 TaxID=3404118 RepID=UPI003B93B813